MPVSSQNILAGRILGGRSGRLTFVDREPMLKYLHPPSHLILHPLPNPHPPTTRTLTPNTMNPHIFDQLPGLLKLGEKSTKGGPIGEIWRGSLNGSLVAIKVIRDTLPPDKLHVSKKSDNEVRSRAKFLDYPVWGAIPEGTSNRPPEHRTVPWYRHRHLPPFPRL